MYWISKKNLKECEVGGVRFVNSDVRPNEIIAVGIHGGEDGTLTNSDCSEVLEEETVVWLANRARSQFGIDRNKMIVTVCTCYPSAVRDRNQTLNVPASLDWNGITWMHEGEDDIIFSETR